MMKVHVVRDKFCKKYCQNGQIRTPCRAAEVGVARVELAVAAVVDVGCEV